MHLEDIIRMAREAGIITNSPYLMPHDYVLHGIERFAALVAAAEREACERLAERSESAEHCAAAIRARGKA